MSPIKKRGILIMAKKKLYLVLDTETATLPFINDICKNEKERKKIAIAKPLVYDIGWTIVDKKGNTYKKENFLVQETFFVPNIFNTAYYKEKRNIYINLLNKGEIKIDNWYNIMVALAADLDTVDLSSAFNATFDFKKAIPFTCRYIYHLYKEDYNIWEQKQKQKCINILNGYNTEKNNDFLIPTFTLFKKNYPITDLWSLACKKVLNTKSYKEFCLDNDLITKSANFFSTSAETAYKYLMLDTDFKEAHTALNDAEIEAQILCRILKKGAANQEIEPFPFKELGTTIDFARNNPQYAQLLINKLNEYLDNNDIGNSYREYQENNLGRLFKILKETK